jgi:23S rRNA (adenine2503-C2)-methyltransferase
MDNSKQPLIGLNREQLGEELQSIGVSASQARMRVDQLWHWLYIRGVNDFDEMLNLGKDLRAALKQKYTIGHPEIVEEQISVDGTRKWLLRFPPRGAGAPVEVETVYIPETDRGTLCVSSQVGCSLTCTFCHTGTQKMVRNLTAEEILGQIMLARYQLGDFIGMESDPEIIAPLEGRKISNVVMMGMGEPLLKLEKVKKAFLIARDNHRLCL